MTSAPESGSVHSFSIAAPAEAVESAGKMRVLGRAIYRGPHLYSQTPMIRIEIDLGRMEQWPTDKIPGFTDKLLALLPSLAEHGCSYGEAGGLVRRMRDGTWLGHVIEHVALELQTLAGAQVARGKTRSVKGKTGVYNVMYEYETEKLGLWAGRLAIELVSSLLPQELSGIEDIDALVGDASPAFTTREAALEKLAAVAAREKLGPSTQAIAEAARKRGIPVTRLDRHSYLQLGWGSNQRRIRATMTDATSHIAVDVAGDKELTKQALAAAGIPVPQGDVVRDADHAAEVAAEIGYPVVVKPLDGNHGRGVSTNLATEADVRRAFDIARPHGRDIIVERYLSGRDYRVLVVGGRVAAVAERVPAHVTGDGRHSIGQLVEKLNADPRRGDGHEKDLSRIVINAQVHDMLARAGLSLDSVPAAGQQVWLCATANLSTGGTAIDRTADIHPDNIRTMERAARAIGLDVTGIDVITPDIGQPLAMTGGGVVEVNACPGLRMHLAPSEGAARPVGEAVVNMLFPEGKASRIPVVAVTGTNGKSTTTRMVAQIFRQQGKTVGFTSTSGIYVDDEMIWAGDASGPQSARRLFANPCLDVAVLETARGGLLREGLACDSVDVGAVLNVTADHLGLSGVHTLEDLADVKSIVTESVSRDGVSVINADDPACARVARHARGRLCYFSMHGGQGMSADLRAHVEAGGMAVVCETWPGRQEIVLHDEGRRIPLMPVQDIPATLNGAAHFNVENALAAAAIAYAMKVDVRTIRAGLSSFATTFERNPGRMNVFDGHGFRVILDYAHNPAALRALLEVSGRLRNGYGRVIGTVSVPGDRRDEDIMEMGRIAASGFDFLVFRENPDRRGRKPGEINALLEKGAMSAGFARDRIVSVYPEEEAIDICLREAKPGDLVLLMPSKVADSWKRVLSYRPQVPAARPASASPFDLAAGAVFHA